MARPAEAVTRLEPDLRPVEARVRHADVGDDHAAGDRARACASDTRQAVRPIQEPEGWADLEFRRVGGTPPRARAGQRVARLEVQHDRLRRRLVRRLADRCAERVECIAMVQQGAVDRAGEPERRGVERNGGKVAIEARMSRGKRGAATTKATAIRRTASGAPTARTARREPGRDHDDHVVVRPRRRAGDRARRPPLDRDAVGHGPGEEPAEQQHVGQCSVRDEVCRRPELGREQHRMPRHRLDPARHVGGDQQREHRQHQQQRQVAERGRRRVQHDRVLARGAVAVDQQPEADRGTTE